MRLIATATIVLLATVSSATSAFFDKRQLQDAAATPTLISEPIAVPISANAEYCPDFAAILQKFGSNIDNVTMPSCAAFVGAEMNQTASEIEGIVKMLGDFLLKEDVGIVAVEGDIMAPVAPSESAGGASNETSNASSSGNETALSGVNMQQLTQDQLMVYLTNLTRVGYSNYFTVFSPDYRMYLLENQLRLMKKYMRWMLNEQAAMAKSIESLWHNQ